MAYSQKYTLVHFISPIDIGTEFHMSHWPLHITVADVFAIDRFGTNIDAKLADLLAQMAPVKTRATNGSLLGTTPVVLLDKSSALLQLHLEVVSLLEANGVVFNNPEFVQNGFLPHSTVQKSGRLYAGDKRLLLTHYRLLTCFLGTTGSKERSLQHLKIVILSDRSNCSFVGVYTWSKNRCYNHLNE